MTIWLMHIECWIPKATNTYCQNMLHLLLFHWTMVAGTRHFVTVYVHCLSFLHKLMHLLVLCRDNLRVALKFQSAIHDIINLRQLIGWVISHLVLRWDISTSETSPHGSRSAISCWRCPLVKQRVWAEIQCK